MTDGPRDRRAATASYIEDMLCDLAMLGRHMNCDFLVFLLEMAQQEAENIKQNQPTPGRKRKKEDKETLTAEELAAIFVRKYSGKH